MSGWPPLGSSETEGRVGVFRHFVEEPEELFGLTLEKAVCGEAGDGSNCTAESVADGADGGAERQIGMDKLRGDGKD